MKFEWDENKNAENIAKHDLDFVDAYQVWDSPMLEFPDTRFDYGEERWIGLGFLDELVVVVVWTYRGAKIRIISLRKALHYEQDRYEAYLKNELGTIADDDGR